MSNVDIKLGNGTTKSLPGSIFSVGGKRNLIHQVSRWQRAKARAGSAKTLTRSEVSGGGKKPWKQKGLGRARAGSSSSPVWVGGGIAHGPKLRDYSFAINKKEKKQALCAAISSRSAEGSLFVLPKLELAEIKTAKAVEELKSAGVSVGRSVLLVVSDADTNAEKSSRNISRLKVTSAKGLNVYSVAAATQLVFTENSLKETIERLA